MLSQEIKYVMQQCVNEAGRAMQLLRYATQYTPAYVMCFRSKTAFRTSPSRKVVCVQTSSPRVCEVGLRG